MDNPVVTGLLIDHVGSNPEFLSIQFRILRLL